jgi:hypothetical protein
MSENLELEISPLPAFDPEVWVKVEGIPYEASTHGRVRSMSSTPRILRPKYGATGSCVVRLCVKGYGISLRSVPKLIADTFVPNPNNLPRLRFKDGNKDNCRADNLEWVDYKRATQKKKPRKKSEKTLMKEAQAIAAAQASWDKLTYAQQQEELRMLERMAKGKPWGIEDGVYLKLPDGSKDTETYNSRIQPTPAPAGNTDPD